MLSQQTAWTLKTKEAERTEAVGMSTTGTTSRNSGIESDGRWSQNNRSSTSTLRPAQEQLTQDLEKAENLSTRPSHHESDEEKDLDSSPSPPYESISTPPQPSPPAPHFQDGGWKAWSVVFGGWCALFSSFGWIMCMGIFQDYYQNVMLNDYNPSTIAWIPSMQACIMFLGAPPFGKIFDAYGPRPLIILGSFFQIFGVMMLSISRTYYQIFLSQGVCSAIGTSALFYAGNNTIGRWFSKRRALATGVVSSGSSTGGVIASLMAQHLIPQVGFGWTVRIIGFLYLFMLVLAGITIQTRLDHHNTRFSVLEFIRPFKLTPVWLTAVASFFFFLGVFIPYDFLIVQANAEGMSHGMAINLLAIMNGASVFGRIIPAWAGDRFGRFNAMIVICYLSGIFIFAIWMQSHTNAVIYVFACLYGFTSGAFVALIPALVAQLSPVTEIGIRMGTNSLTVAVAVLVGNPIGGALITAANGRFYGTQAFAGGVLLVGATFFVFAKLAQSRKFLDRV